MRPFLDDPGLLGRILDEHFDLEGRYHGSRQFVLVQPERVMSQARGICTTMSTQPASGSSHAPRVT